jgi:hypothetical protein
MARLGRPINRLEVERLLFGSLSCNKALSAFVKTLSDSGALGAYVNQILYRGIIRPNHDFSHENSVFCVVW